MRRGSLLGDLAIVLFLCVLLFVGLLAAQAHAGEPPPDPDPCEEVLMRLAVCTHALTKCEHQDDSFNPLTGKPSLIQDAQVTVHPVHALVDPMPVVPKNRWLLGAGVAPRIGGNGLMGKFEALSPSRQWSVFAAVTQVHTVTTTTTTSVSTTTSTSWSRGVPARTRHRCSWVRASGGRLENEPD